MKSINVWDNFYLLTRGYQAENFADLNGHIIHVPLAKGTPPFGVTKYLMKKLGYDPEEFDFAFGQPFGRPEDLKAKFVRGKIDTVLLREPEASFALKAAEESFDIMGQTPEAVEKFLGRVSFDFKSGLDYSDQIIHYLKVLAEESSFISKGDLSELENMFK